MGRKKYSRYRRLIPVLMLAFGCTVAAHEIYQAGIRMRLEREGVANAEFRRDFFDDRMRADREELSGAARSFLEAVEEDSVYFPIPESELDASLGVSYVDSWMGERNYKGKSGHEGTDLMADKNERGVYPVLSISDGTVTSLGWLEKGGWRVGITSPSGVYYYYAHLESYADLSQGDRIRAGDLLGFMGDSGYGKEGTVGKFAVHLHLGVYCLEDGKEISVNPYYLLRMLEERTLKYYYM